MPTKDELRILQAYPLDLKIAKTKLRIGEWVDHYGVDGVYVSFSPIGTTPASWDIEETMDKAVDSK